VRDVELKTARHLDDSFRGTCGDKAGRVEIGLCEDAGERRENVAEEPAGGLVARRTAVADARVYEKDRYAIASRRPDEVRPYLAFGENYRTRADGLQRALDEVREVERIVYEDIALGDFLLCHLPAGGARRRKGKLDAWLDLPPFAHQLARDLDLADRNGMDPDERWCLRTFGAGACARQSRAGAWCSTPELCQHLVRIECEPVAHPRGISAAPQHADKKARQEKRIDDGEQ